MKRKTFVIAGGGTGGHVYPGLALAESLVQSHPDADIHFVGAEGGLEEKIVPQAGYPIHLLKVGRLHSSVGLWRRLKALLMLPYSFFQSLYLYFKLRPQWVLGVGGFASGPFVFTAAFCGGRTAILEPNAFPGMANRWLARWVKYCFVVFQDAGHHFPADKVIPVGLPVRMKKQPSVLSYDGSTPFKVLIFGGSQGARGINRVVGDWVEGLGEQKSFYEIYHQTGRRDYQQWVERYGKKHEDFLTYTDYIDDMPARLAWADLVVCRSGVGSVAEVAMSSRPALFIPLPTSADNHQVKNAQVLEQLNAALMIEEKDLTAKVLGDAIENLRSHPEMLSEMMERLKVIDYSNAQSEILKHLMGNEK